jgi:hypothetical protein
MIRAAFALLLGLALAASLSGCTAAFAGPVAAPPWEPVAFGAGDADFVGAINLEAMRADPVFGPLMEQVARKEDMGVLMRASQVDVVATVEDGKPVTWLGVVHGVEGPPRQSDIGARVGAPQSLASGATEYHGSTDIIAVPGAWIVGEGTAFERARSSPGMLSPRVTMPSRALVASTAQGRAFPSSRERVLVDMTEGLSSATVEMLGGAHLEFVLQCRYVDRSAARRAAAAARVVLLAAASSHDSMSVLARALMKVDFDVSGELVSLRVTLSDDLRDVLQRYVERAME